MYPDNDTNKKKKTSKNKTEDLDLADISANFGKTGSGSKSANQNLLSIKQQALSQLSSLVDNLEQSPEQHFRTLMMIIQETDNVDMIDKAYAAALLLKDPKEKAQAMLAIANEINYFTSK